MSNQADQSAGTITSVDGKRTITVEEFDRMFDDGEDVSEFFDFSKARTVTPQELGVPPGRTLAEATWIREEKDGVVRMTATWDGKRPAAARKPRRQVCLQIHVSPATRRRMQRLAKQSGMSLSQVVESRFAKP